MKTKKYAAMLLDTDRDIGLLIIRLTLGLVMFPHGTQKLLGWFGGYGFSGTMGFFTDQLGVPALPAFLVILAESLGALALIAGVVTRLAAFGIGASMIGAILMVHAPNGFFMNWYGVQAGEGFEYHLLVIGMALALIIRGGGLLAADRILAGNLKGELNEKH